MPRRLLLILVSALALLACGVTVVVLDAVGDDSAAPQPVPPPAPFVVTTTTTTTPEPPPLFPPIVPGFEVNTVRTGSGHVLPVLGGGPGAWEVRTPCSNAAVVSGVPIPGAHVVLDPGHGGSEPGAVGPAGLTEKELNLDVAMRAAALLRADGAVVHLTRQTDLRVTLSTRGEIVRSLDPLAFISVHHNAAPIGKAERPGSELYHQLADPQSQRLAGLLWEEFQEHLAPFGTDWAVGDAPGARARQSVRTGDDFYGVLRNTQGVPAVLSEAAYLSNPAEEALLLTDAFRDAEARAIADAVIRLVSTDDPGSGFQPVKVSDASAGGGGGPVGCVDPPLF